MIGSAEGISTHQTRSTPIDSRVIIEHLEIFNRRFGKSLLVFCPTKHLCMIIGTCDSLLHIWDHTATVVCNELQVRVFFQYSTEYKAGHSCCRLIGPTEDVKNHIFGPLLSPIVCKVGGSLGMYPYR